MRILIVYRYFWPDTPPYAAMLRDITGWLAESGHQVEVLTAQPAYKPEVGIPPQPKKEMLGNVKVRRLWLLPESGRGAARAINAALFVFQAFLITLFGQRRDVVWTATMPPVFQAFVLMLAVKLRGSRFLYHMQDIYPEVGVSGGILANGKMARILRWFDNQTLNQTDVNVVLSDDMKMAISQRGAEPDHVAVINNYAWGRTGETGEIKSDKNDPMRFVFAGNVGRFQNLGPLVEAFSSIDGAFAELHLLGEGKAKQELQRQVNESGAQNIHFHDHLPDDQAYTFMRGCDVGIVTLMPELYRYAFPSKVWTYMAADLPILAIVEAHSNLARLIEDNSIGISVDWNSGDSELRKSIEDTVAAIRSGGFRRPCSVPLYKPEHAQSQWIELFAELDNSGDTK